jgi:hypothetical protein
MNALGQETRLNAGSVFMGEMGTVKQQWIRPKSSAQSYQKASQNAVQDFLKGNRVIETISAGQFKMNHYHALLKAIFHQVYFSSTSFAMAGAMASNTSVHVRTYLLHHAEEEMNHWMWILEDLQATGYNGPDPRSDHPNWASQAYLSYGVYLSIFNPIGRLAMAQVLEGISGTFGTTYGMKGLQSLGISKEQAKFFLLHGELDQGHSHDIDEVLNLESLSAEQWAELEHVARTTSQLYKNIYNFAME